MTIFLTTQYLEEADELADRVGIIDDGQIVAEGSPTELKRRVGNDVIVARVSGHSPECLDLLRALSGVRNVEAHGEELLVAADDGPATIGRVAVAVSTVTTVKDLTLRTPTLDDVFLDLTGNRIDRNSSAQSSSSTNESLED